MKKKRTMFTRILIYMNIGLLVIALILAGELGIPQSLLAAVKSAPPKDTPVYVAAKADNLVKDLWWQQEIKYQVVLSENKHFDGCLFGDSISSYVGNNLGVNNFNFAVSGMSSVSMLGQLKILKNAQVQCDKVIFAIGTNDAVYKISNDAFVQNLQQSVSTAKAMGASKIIFLPAFYSTLAATRNPDAAGPIERVDEISDLIRQVATAEKVEVLGSELQALYQGKALRDDMTLDGVHLNADGRKIYRQYLLKLLASAA